MNSLVKYTLIAAGIGGILYLVKLGKDTVNQWSEKFNLRIVQFGKPTLSGGNLSVPLKVRISNPAPVGATIQSASVKLFYLRNGMYVPFGVAPPTAPFHLMGNGDTDIMVNPVIDLNALDPFTGGGFNLNNLFAQIKNLATGQNPLIDVKAEVAITIEGFEIVEETTSKIYLNQLINAA